MITMPTTSDPSCEMDEIVNFFRLGNGGTDEVCEDVYRSEKVFQDYLANSRTKLTKDASNKEIYW